MNAIINNIKSAINGGAPIAALTLALTVPDICAQIAYPELASSGNVGARYKKWFNEYLDKYYRGNFTLAGIPLGIPEFTANICYRLRCALLHSGNADTDMSILSEMSFWVPSSGAAYTDCDTGIAKKMPDGGIHTTIVLNITQFCDNMCDAAEKFYCSWPDKGDFDTHKIQIIYGEAPKP